MTVHIVGSTPEVEFVAPPRHYRSSKRHFHHGERRAVVRALTAARLYINNEVPTLEAAAESCGSCVAYVRAVIILRRAENADLVQDVVAGRIAILRAAREAQRLANLVTAYREAGNPDRVAFARTCGIEAIFDTLVQAST